MAYDPWDARIERVDNGYIVYLSGDTPNEGSIAVCEDADRDGGKIESFASALFEIQAHFGMLGDVHKEHIVIRREMGE
jgi:hypothetical protein